MAGPYDVVTGVFDQAKLIADELRADALAKINAATSTATNITPITADNIPRQVADLQRIDLDKLSTNTFLAGLTGIEDELNAAVDTKTEQYVSTIFPLDSNLSAAQSWLARVLAGDGVLAPAHEERLWTRDRSRAHRDAQQAIDGALTSWAARGYALPPGGAVGAVLAAQRTAMESNAAASNAIALKTYETEIGLMKEAVDQTIRMRVEMVRNMAEYIKTAAIAPTLGLEVRRTASEAQRVLADSAKVYFDLDNAYSRAGFNADRDFIQFGREFKKLKFDTDLARVDEQVKLALQAAQMMATMAASALNGIHAQAAISGSSSDATTTQLFG